MVLLPSGVPAEHSGSNGSAEGLVRCQGNCIVVNKIMLSALLHAIDSPEISSMSNDLVC